ncbi:MAG: DUF2325 domain-containing protein [Pseudomonadota bacterium]
MKRCRLVAGDDITPYGLHGYFAQEVARDCPLARTVQKFLDRRNAGMVRVVGKLTDEAALAELWQREYDAGRIAGAYWALQTYAHVSEDLHVKIFGDVHMLSHILGRTVHATAARASELQAHIEDLESKVARQSAQHRSALEARDGEIALLRSSQLRGVADKNAAPCAIGTDDRIRRRFERQGRALSAARERARTIEAEKEGLASELQKLNAEVRVLRRRTTVAEPTTDCPGAKACQIEIDHGENLKILYLGGRSSAVTRLREIANAASAEFIHHDGGKGEAFSRIGGLISQCHVVFCPVDCISHRACLYAKDRCRRLEKAFVPLPSSGGKTFERALQDLQVA